VILVGRARQCVAPMHTCVGCEIATQLGTTLAMAVAAAPSRGSGLRLVIVFDAGHSRASAPSTRQGLQWPIAGPPYGKAVISHCTKRAASKAINTPRTHHSEVSAELLSEPPVPAPPPQPDHWPVPSRPAALEHTA
jgi:hypothetical protein